MSDSDDHICTRCGEQYDWMDVDAPEDATIYWAPHCPSCNAKMTANTVDSVWMDIIGSDLEKGQDEYEYYRQKVHYHARLCHGRLAGLSVEELVARAQWFDERVSQGRRFGPEPDRDVAFALRKQARGAPTA